MSSSKIPIHTGCFFVATFNEGWLYLEPILSGDDGELGGRFRKVDQGFRQAMRVVETDPRLSALLQSTRLQPMLDAISEQLAGCQAALSQYIDDKRSTFPRLYFLSDDDLLELLGQARAGAEGREAVMQTHLKKLFPGTTGVRLGPGGLSITALCSHYDETFQLDHPVDIDCPVEVWLKNLETQMRSSLKSLTLKCVATKSLQDQDPFSLPTQILCLAQNMRFTEQVERAIASKDLHNLKVNVEKENAYYASTEVEDESERHKRQALILQCANYMGVVRSLIDNNVASTDDWNWRKQLRFYLSSTKEVVARMGLAEIAYSYEYLGVTTGQFVRTDLADECFFILTQSLHLGLVGNPFGPAGTGKTESVKALGGLVGRLVLIFNCDEAMDAACMGRLLSGIALCGAWGCFDEFNRLSSETLAAVSHQLSSLLEAYKQRNGASALLNGKQIPVSPWCGVAATMNPVERGYGGRRHLPAALERVVRGIAMVQPEPAQLATHLFAARCIPDAHVLADNLHTVFSVADALLSGCRYYDWGLRALKAAVGSCSALVRRGPLAPRAALRATLRLNNVSKLTRPDADRFENILAMVFADVPEEESTTNPIHAALEMSTQTLGLVTNKLQIEKCMELYEQLQQRMGVVIVGPPGSGKTTMRKLLKTALTSQGKNIVEYIICPKAMSREWLLGHIDQDTRQWTDGVISTTALEVSNQPQDVWSWIVCDGDIDPEWIEALNSVLDDNRLLTLPSGWRIQFGSNVNFIFETHSLEHASPATVSRMGIILLSDDASCAEEAFDSWYRKAEFENESVKMAALPFLQQTVKKCIRWFSAHKSDFVIKQYSISMVKHIVSHFEYNLQNVELIKTSPEELVYLAIQRAVCGLLKKSALDSFYDEMSQILGPPLSPPQSASEWATDGLFLSTRLASTEAGLRCAVHSNSEHLLLYGPPASGNNLLTEYVLKESNSTVIIIDCTPLLEPADIIAELRRNNVVRSGGAGSNSHVAVSLFVRALHRARFDAWGSSPVHSFLLQLIQHSGFWYRDVGDEGGMQWHSVVPLRLVTTAHRPATEAARLSAALSVVLTREPDEDELLELVTTYLKQNIDKNVDFKDLYGLAKNIISMFKEVTETFYSRPHYKWNASHLKKWCENVKWYSPTNPTELNMAIHAEANMIFRDRLVTDEERSQYDAICKNYLKSNYERLYFMPKLRSDGVYMEAVDYKLWYLNMQKVINQCLTEHEYNAFGDTGVEVCSELAVLCPAIAKATNSGGVVVCVGSAGAGRRAAALLVAGSVPATFYCVDKQHQFNNIMKTALSSAGEGARAVAVVSGGAADGPSLSAVEALQAARAPHALPAALLPNHYSHNLLENIKQNLGIVICLDKDQNNLNELMEKYPLLYNDSHLVWLDHWFEETLRELPRLIIQRLMKEDASDISKEELEIPTQGFVSIYSSLEATMRAPCRYVAFIKSYYHLVCKKTTALMQRQQTLTAGVEALERAETEVAKLQKEAAEQEILLSEKQTKANEALEQIGATVRATTDKKEEMHALKQNIEEENTKLQIRKKEIEAELATVEPLIAEARAAVGFIKPESLSEMRSLRAPPDVVRDVLEGVLRLMGVADTSWHSMKNFLAKRGVKEDIRCMDASQISPEAIESVQRLLAKRGASFDQATAKRASAACAPLAAWVTANLAHAAALARVQPLQAQQRALRANLKEAENQLAALSAGLGTVDSRVSALQQQLGQHTRDAAALELRLRHVTDTLGAAAGLVRRLRGETAAWQQALEHISKEISEVTTRSLLAAGYIVYLPELTEPQAKESINKWSELLGFDEPSFSVISFLSTTEKQLKWDAEGLPSDMSAVKNAVLIDQVLESHKVGLTPLLVDPEGEAAAWLRRHLADRAADFVSQHAGNLHTAVQYAVRLSRILVITDVDSIHDSYAAILSGLPVTSTGNVSGARLLLQCRDVTLPGKLPPYYAARLSVINFTATLHGLTDQLVHYALQQQSPEVNEKAKEIKLKKATLQKQQHELQENLLRDLSTNSDILNDANLLASLNKTRSTSETINEALEAARAIEEQTRIACEAYESSANKAALVTLAVKGLEAQKPLIALPIDAVLDVYVDAVRRNSKREDPNNINNDEVVKYVIRRIIERVLLSLHKQDKYIIVLHILKQVYSDLIPDNLWNIFIDNVDLLNEDENLIANISKKYSWLPEEYAKKVALLKTTAEDLYNKLNLDNEGLWRSFQQSGDLQELSPLRLAGFEPAIATACTRTDSLYRAIVVFVDEVLGAGIMSRADAISSAYKMSAGRDSRPPRPVLLLAAHAADVLRARVAGLKQVGIEEGRSAWDAAIQSSRGNWLAIVVGASPFTPDFLAFLEAYAERSSSDFTEEFRLWIVTEDREIPSAVSNSCINVILEPPEGVKHNVINTVSAWGDYSAAPGVVRAHVCLALLHAAVQERRAHAERGWTRHYAWDWGDVSAAAALTRAACAATFDSAAARALLLAVYGARVVAAPDRAALRALLAALCGDEAHAQRWAPPGTDVVLPFDTRLQSYLPALDSLPSPDPPRLLGLAANCRAAAERRSAELVCKGLRDLNMVAVVTTRKPDSVEPKKMLLSLWKKLMSGSPLLKADYQPEQSEAGGWWSCVVSGEARGAGLAARLVHASLSDRLVHASLADRTAAAPCAVPESWQLQWAGPLAPAAYLRELCARAAHAATRAATPPTKCDLRTFLYPARVAWVLRVRAAQRLGCNVHAVSLTLTVSSDGASPDDESMIVVGLQVSGALWAGPALARCGARDPPHAPAPPLRLAAQLSSRLAAGQYSLPVYSDASRRSLLFTAQAPLTRDFPEREATLNAAAMYVAPIE